MCVCPARPLPPQARIAASTVDDELAADPALAEEIDAEIQAKHFMP